MIWTSCICSVKLINCEILYYQVLTRPSSRFKFFCRSKQCVFLYFFWIFPFLYFEWMCVGWEGESRRAWLICPKIEIWSQTFKTWKYREWRVTRGQDISKRKSRKQFNTDEKLYQGFYFLNSTCFSIKTPIMKTISNCKLLFHCKNVLKLQFHNILDQNQI